jgi:hypothetical protein
LDDDGWGGTCRVVFGGVAGGGGRIVAGGGPLFFLVLSRGGLSGSQRVVTSYIGSEPRQRFEGACGSVPAWISILRGVRIPLRPGIVSRVQIYHTSLFGFEGICIDDRDGHSRPSLACRRRLTQALGLDSRLHGTPGRPFRLVGADGGETLPWVVPREVLPIKQVYDSVERAWRQRRPRDWERNSQSGIA